MAHWAGNRNIPDAHYPTNAKWPEPWQPWKRHALKQRKNGFPSRLALESELSEIEHEKKLIEHGNDSNKLLFEAILQGDWEAFQMALDDCCSLEARAPGSSCTPLMVAAAAGRADMCRALLDVGARPEAKDSASGATAFLMAAFKARAGSCPSSPPLSHRRRSATPLCPCVPMAFLQGTAVGGGVRPSPAEGRQRRGTEGASPGRSGRGRQTGAPADQARGRAGNRA
eukprot:CAMPEP_0177583802 /NCGR_PEP_ID=MMETSP0419_2-20121207/3527_1 /TAXON_ID=582737 /ORGANISM="Tetraselmis sp., Strain GSL018" /LENGTH=226 /DNA_ID=CAMNT_0019073239 /DNA_START=251 /DNA_END=928 /DNA_ORIENTATION=-